MKVYGACRLWTWQIMKSLRERGEYDERSQDTCVHEQVFKTPTEGTRPISLVGVAHRVHSIHTAVANDTCVHA